MSDERLEAARAEAERRYPEGWDHYNDEPVDDWGFSAAQREGFLSGARWADANPQPTITEEELNMAAIEVVGDRLPARGPRAYDLLHDALIALGIEVVEGDR